MIAIKSFWANSAVSPSIVYQSFVTMASLTHEEKPGLWLFFKQIPARSPALRGQTVGKTSAIWPLSEEQLFDKIPVIVLARKQNPRTGRDTRHSREHTQVKIWHLFQAIPRGWGPAGPWLQMTGAWRKVCLSVSLLMQHPNLYFDFLSKALYRTKGWPTEQWKTKHLNVKWLNATNQGNVKSI